MSSTQCHVDFSVLGKHICTAPEKLGKQFPVLSYSSFASTVRKVKINSIKFSVLWFKGICQVGAVHTEAYLITSLAQALYVLSGHQIPGQVR